MPSLVGSEMCIRDRAITLFDGIYYPFSYPSLPPSLPPHSHFVLVTSVSGDSAPMTLPTTASSLPTLGSLPAMAALNSGELTTALPRRRARSDVGAPVTRTCETKKKKEKKKRGQDSPAWSSTALAQLPPNGGWTVRAATAVVSPGPVKRKKKEQRKMAIKIRQEGR